MKTNITVTVPKTREKYQKYYSNCTENRRKVHKTTERYQKSNCTENNRKLPKTTKNIKATVTNTTKSTKNIAVSVPKTTEKY